MAPDRFGRLLAAGVFVMLLVQVMENIGMNVGLLPIAGIPLPLISYGGSATITTMAALGLVQCGWSGGARGLPISRYRRRSRVGCVRFESSW